MQSVYMFLLCSVHYSWKFPFFLLEKSKPQEAGKEKARTLIIGFRESCKKRIENRQLGPYEFEIGKMLLLSV